MICPDTPVIPGHDFPEVLVAEHQEEYMVMPAIFLHDNTGTILTRWRLTWKDRLKILLTGNIWVWMMAFGQRIQPIKLTADKPEVTQ